MGLKDSKALSAKRREFLSKRIEKVCAVQLQEITAQQIDELRTVMTVNEILGERPCSSLAVFKARCSIVDAADVKGIAFSERVKEGERDKQGNRRAQGRYKLPLLVSAASIIAKVSRDSSIRALESSSVH